MSQNSLTLGPQKKSRRTRFSSRKPTEYRQNTDVIQKALSDIVNAAGLLSRLPVPWRRFQHVETGSDAAWAYPIAGALIGLVAAMIGGLAGSMPINVQAAIIVTTLIIATGAMHEDGLADSVDGLWGGWDRQRRLEIMKDSRIGAYGVLALILSVLIRWSALAALLSAGMPLYALIGIAALSRVPMVALMTWLPNARNDGLSAQVGAPPATALWLALAVGLIVGVATLGLTTIALMICMGITCLIWALIAKQKIGGQTGDILGATQQISEITILLTLCVLTL